MTAVSWEYFNHMSDFNEILYNLSGPHPYINSYIG